MGTEVGWVALCPAPPAVFLSVGQAWTDIPKEKPLWLLICNCLKTANMEFVQWNWLKSHLYSDQPVLRRTLTLLLLQCVGLIGCRTWAHAQITVSWILLDFKTLISDYWYFLWITRLPNTQHSTRHKYNISPFLCFILIVFILKCSSCNV